MKLKLVILSTLLALAFAGCKKKEPAGDNNASNIGGSLYFEQGEGEDKGAFPACLEYYTTGDTASMAAVKQFVAQAGAADDVTAVKACDSYKANAKFSCRIQDKEASKVITGVTEGTTVTYLTYYLGKDEAGAKSACEKKAGKFSTL